MNKRMLVMLVACAILFGGIFGFKWFGSRMMNQFFDTMPVPPVTVSTAAARAETWPLSLDAVGTLAAVRGTDVTTEASGIVDSIRFESGQSVPAGAALLTLDRSTDQAELEALEADAALAQQQLDRARNLAARDAIAKSELDRSAAEAAAAAANVEAQRARIAQKVIRAPFAGRLGIRRVDLGQHLSPGTPIVSLQSLDPIYVDFRLPQQHVGRIREGLPITIDIDAFAGRSFKGRVTAVAPLVDMSTRNFEAQATLANDGRVLRPGMFAAVRIDLGQSEETVVVPQTAISYNPYGDSVWVIKARTGEALAQAERRVVEVGRRQGDLVQILEGLEAGEQIATSGLLKLRSGVPVMVDNTVQPSADRAPEPPNS